MPQWTIPNGAYTVCTSFQTGNSPVYLRGKSDRFLYRSAMAVSLAGVSMTFFCIYLMATNQMKRKER